MKRREFLQTTLATTLAASQSFATTSEDPAGPSRVIDTHTHFYDPTRPAGVPWPSPGTPLYRRVMPSDWRAVAESHGIHETIIVEASPWVEDNQWILDVAATDHSIVGFVGNLDPRDAQFTINLNRFAQNPLFRGLRWRSDLVPIDRDLDQLASAAKQLVDLDLELDLNGSCQSLPMANRLAESMPKLRIVINHLGASGDPQAINVDWRKNIDQISKCPNVFMKVSALVEQIPGESGKAPTNTEYYKPVLDHLWNRFGEDRLIYGSNWPVSDRGATYDVVFKIVRDYFMDKGSGAMEKYFWKNSLHAYRWLERA